MAQTEEEIRERARTVARELYERGKDDPEFTQQFLNDPVTTMREAGMPEETMAEALVASGVARDEGEVQGFMLGPVKSASFDPVAVGRVDFPPAPTMSGGGASGTGSSGPTW